MRLWSSEGSSSGRTIAVVAATLLPATAAVAYAPPVPLRPIKRFCTGRGAARVCATVDRRVGRTTVVRAGRTWTVASAAPAVTPRADGGVIAEEYRPGGLIEMSDRLAMVLVVLRTPAGVVNRLTIGGIARRVTDLPATESHRQWSTVR